MDNIAASCYTDIMMSQKKKRKTDGFPDEQYYMIPTESFDVFLENPLVKALYLTDIGFFPEARFHFCEREEGTEEYILIYCAAGVGYVEIDGIKYTLHEQEALTIPRGRVHRYYADETDPWSIFWVHFKGENATFYPLEDCEVIEIGHGYAENRIITLFDILFRVLQRNYTIGNFIYISQVLGLILAEIYYREKGDEVSRQNKCVTSIVRYMYKHLNEPLDLDQICREFQISKSSLNATFKKYANHTPIDFFIDLKMQEACKLLKSTNRYISEISSSLGYEDPYYFSRIFKKYVGVSPKEYRRREEIK